MRILSWNLYYRNGAAAADISNMIVQNRPDVFLMQEATPSVHRLPTFIGGQFFELPWRGKTYGLATWLPDEMLELAPKIDAIELPYSNLPGRFPQREAQRLRFGGVTIVNVHLSHGQLLNRRQLRTISERVDGPLAIVGDFNALGPIVMRGFSDVGPRRVTHYGQKFAPFRLDRCMLRGLKCDSARVLERGPSDHRPIMLELDVT